MARDLNHTRPAAIEAGQSLENCRMGNPPAKYTPGLHAHVVDLIKKGHRPIAAARQAGIASHMFYRWMNLGKNGDPHLFQFSEDVEQAVAIFEGTMVDVVIEDASNDAKSAQWMLERRHPEGYSKEVDAKVNGIIANFMANLKEHLTDAEYFRVVAVSSGFSGSETIMLSESIDDTEQKTGT